MMINDPWVISTIFAFLCLLFVAYSKLRRYQKDLQLLNRQLRLREKQLRIAASQVAGVIFEYLPEKQIYRIISSDESIGISFQEISAQGLRNFVIAAEDLWLYDQTFEILKKGVPSVAVDIRLKLSRSSSELRWHHIKMQQVEEEGLMSLIGTVQDIHDRKVRELQHEQDMQYQNALLTGALAHFSVNLTTNQIVQGTLDGIDVSKPAQNQSYEEYTIFLSQQIIHPEDREHYLATYRCAYLLEQYADGNKDITIEYRRLVHDEYHWVQCNLHMICDLHSKDVIALFFVNDINDRKKEEHLLRDRAQRDPLTGLLNRLTYEKKVEEILLMEAHTQHLHALLILDLDDFKAVNDTYGHMVGDYVIREMAGVLYSVFRKEDVIGRLGGDEFMVFMKNIPSAEYAELKAFEFEQALNQKQFGEFKELKLTCSIGIGIGSGQADFRGYYLVADQATYRAKGAGKATVTIASEEPKFYRYASDSSSENEQFTH